jgi:hypothetical protein
VKSNNKPKKTGLSKREENTVDETGKVIRLRPAPKLETDELSVALEIQSRHKRLRMETGTSESLRAAIKELSHPDVAKKYFKREK